MCKKNNVGNALHNGPGNNDDDKLDENSIECINNLSCNFDIDSVNCSQKNLEVVRDRCDLTESQLNNETSPNNCKLFKYQLDSKKYRNNLTLTGVTLNVSNLSDKLKYGVIDEYFSKKDIITCVETKTDYPNFKHTYLQEFKCFSKSKPLHKVSYLHT